MKAVPFGAALALAGCASTPREAPFIVRVAGPSDPCVLNIAGQPTTLDQLLDIARREASHRRVAKVVGDGETPYRCVGGVIYTPQMAGFLKVEFDTQTTTPKR